MVFNLCASLNIESESVIVAKLLFIIDLLHLKTNSIGLIFVLAKLMTCSVLSFVLEIQIT